MLKNPKINYPLLQQVISEFFRKREHIGVYHFNKILYLFEYFYIKNTGKRFLKEPFIKLPHGPVVSNYKRQLENLFNDGILIMDISELKKHRDIDSDRHIKLAIRKGYNINNYSIQDYTAFSILSHVIEKYSDLSIDELEQFVYHTEPVIRYQINSEGYKMRKKIGGYVLRSPNINITKYKKTISEGAKLAAEHLKKYPTINIEQLNKDIEEFAFLEKLRPSYE
jgi:hypothetical protein